MSFIEDSGVVTIFCSVICVLTLVVIQIWVRRRKYTFPPGPDKDLTTIKNGEAIATSHLYLTDLRQKYGDIFTVKVAGMSGCKPFLYVGTVQNILVTMRQVSYLTCVHEHDE